MRSSPNVVGDALKTPDIPRQVGDVAQHVQTQLTSTIDVKAAHSWVQPSGGEAHLPSLGFGGEGASMHAAIPGGEQHALAAAQQVGNQAISPIIQMIMKMPGHIGLISSFFEALQSFFAPLQDLIGGLDASVFTANLEAAASALHGGAGEHFGFDISLIPEDAPIFSMDDGGGGFADLLPKDGSAALSGTELKFNPSEVSDAGGNALNTSGYSDAGGPQFEQAPAGLESATHSVRDGIVTPQYLAMDNGQAIFRPTMGGFNNMPTNAIQVPPNVTPVQPTVVHPLTHQIAPHHSVARDIAPTANQLPEHTAPALEHHAAAHPALEQHHAAQPATEAAADRGTLLGHPHTRVEHVVDQVTSEQPADAGQAPTDHVAESPQAPEQGAEATTSYTVKPGDNLWDIAQHHLGDGLKWQEIYQLNHDLLGSDPTLIHPGTEIQLPGGAGQELAANYTVQSGDNLWDISKAHLGGGQHWGELFHQNSDVIGSNPSLIHPGQHLDMSGGGANHAGQLASADPSHAASHHAGSHVAHHAAPQHQQVAHNATPTHHVAQHHGAADHAKVAANTPHTSHPAEAPTQQVAAGSQQVPEALAATPSGHEAGLHAAAPMGSLETTAQSLPNK